MSKLVAILGAGFSKPAGLPLANDINARFDRDQIGKLLRISSGEWYWIDGKDSSLINNGSMGDAPKPYSYILNELIKDYRKKKGSFINYEDFYNYVIEGLRNKSWYGTMCKKAKEAHFLSNQKFFENPDAREYWSRPYDEKSSRKIIEVLDYLIADLIGLSNQTIENSISEYESFLNKIIEFDEVVFYTLNHDLLLERLLSYKKHLFSRGFSYEGSDVYYNGNPLPVFNNDFRGTIKIVKLHGSVDFFRFRHYENQGGLYWKPTGQYNYFTTHGYRTKHFAVRVNPITKETIQDMNFDVSPKFITGINKEQILSEDVMFRKLFKRFELSITEAKMILISGYSFNDEHINKELMKRDDLVIINQNPHVDYPFRAKQINNLNRLRDF